MTLYAEVDAEEYYDSIEPLAKLPTGKFCKPISAPEKPFF